MRQEAAMDGVQPGAAALLQFRRDSGNAGVSRRGPITRGGRLVIEYDPSRLLPDPHALATGWRVLYHVRFRAGDEPRSGTLRREHDGVAEQPAGWNPVRAEEIVPSDATQVELWFEGAGPQGPANWDSRYGQNYRFEVDGQGLLVPEQSVVLRRDATIEPHRIRVLQDTASKAASRIGIGGRRLHTDLVVRAEVESSPTQPHVWADIHVFDAVGELIQGGTVTLQPSDPAEVGTLAVWEGDVYQGSQGGSGMGVSFRPDAHTVQYRVYGEVGAQTFTDGVLHQFAVPADEEVRHS